MPEVISRRAAKDRGLTRYFTGPCAKGHVSERYVKSCACVRCHVNKVHEKQRASPEGRRRRKLDASAAHKRSPTWRLIRSLRMRVRGALLCNRRPTKDLGCTAVEAREFVQSQFTNDMTWANWGSVWELDHRAPFRSVDLDDPDQLKAVLHYSNLQPLLIADHRSKTNRERVLYG